MAELAAGVIFWWVGHLWGRLAPRARLRAGAAARGISAAIIALGLVLMILGYRSAESVLLWQPPVWGQHVNNGLMLLAMIALALAHSRGAVAARLAHPMLLATMLWSLAHLLVRGDGAALVLFGGIGLWAVVERVLLRGRGITARGGMRRDAIGFVVGLILYGIVGYVHGIVGPTPFPGG